MGATKLSALLAVALLALLAEGVDAQGKASGVNCAKDQSKIINFRQAQIYTGNGRLGYQLQLTVKLSFAGSLDIQLFGAAGSEIYDLYRDQAGSQVIYLNAGPDPLESQGEPRERIRVQDDCGREMMAAARITAPGSHGPQIQCLPYVVVDAHGSGDKAGVMSAPGAEFVGALSWDKQTEVDFRPAPYTAAGGIPGLVSGALKLPLGYHGSVVQMKQWLRWELSQIHRSCPRSAIFVTGYSQGAQAAGDVYQERAQKGLAWQGVRGWILFGDPSFNPYDSSARFGMNSKPALRHTTHQGFLGSRKPFNAPLVISFCHRGDPVCQGVSQLIHGPTNHNNYTQFNEAGLAAEYFVKKWG